MKYAIANMEMCKSAGLDIDAYRVIEDKVILNENDLLMLGDTAEAGAARVGAVPVTLDEAKIWIREHSENIIKQ